MLRRGAVRRNPEEVAALAELQGKLPLGAFKEVAWGRVEREAALWRQNLTNKGISSEEIFEILLSCNCKKAELVKPGLWVLPALSLKMPFGKDISIVGTISDVTKHGMLCFGKDTFSETLKIWPRFLIYEAIKQHLPFDVEDKIVFVQSGKERRGYCDGKEGQIIDLLSYYFFCQEYPSPLLPELIEEIWKGDMEALEKKLRLEQGKDWKTIYNAQLDWMLGKEEVCFDKEHLLALQAWFPKKKFKNE